MSKRTGLLTAMIALATTLFPSAAAGMPPTRVQMPVNYVQDLPSGSLCPFDLTFTGTGTITVTTYYDNAGNPRSQTVHGALTHTIFSAWHTLTSSGPAPVHINLGAGQMIDTGREFALRSPGTGLSWAKLGASCPPWTAARSRSWEARSPTSQPCAARSVHDLLARRCRSPTDRALELAPTH